MRVPPVLNIVGVVSFAALPLGDIEIFNERAGGFLSHSLVFTLLVNVEYWGILESFSRFHFSNCVQLIFNILYVNQLTTFDV